MRKGERKTEGERGGIGFLYTHYKHQNIIILKFALLATDSESSPSPLPLPPPPTGGAVFFFSYNSTLKDLLFREHVLRVTGDQN